MKNAIRIGSIVLLCLFLLGCSNVWIPDQRPETPEERKAVADHAARILSNIPQTLSGHDQDWDDAIAEAQRVAVKTWCKTRLYEFQRGFNATFTGRMKEVQ